MKSELMFWRKGVSLWKVNLCLESFLEKCYSIVKMPKDCYKQNNISSTYFQLNLSKKHLLSKPNDLPLIVNYNLVLQPEEIIWNSTSFRVRYSPQSCLRLFGNSLFIRFHKKCSWLCLNFICRIHVKKAELKSDFHLLLMEKVSVLGVILGHIFPAFVLNTERYRVFLRI